MEEQAVVTTCSRASPYDSYLTDLVRYLLQCVLSQKRHGGILNCGRNHAVSCATTLFTSSLTCPACNQTLQEPYVSLFDYDLQYHFPSDRSPNRSDDIVVRRKCIDFVLILR